MMSDVKMSESFHSDIDHDGNGQILENGFPIFGNGCKYKANAAATAINSYDSNQELIAKQAEEIKEFYGLCVRDGEAIIKQAAQIKQLRDELVRQRQAMSNAIELDIFHVNYIDEASRILDGLDSVLAETKE